MTTANFTKPVVGDLRADVLQYVRDYMAAQAKMFDGDTLVSQPTRTIRFSLTNGRFEVWNGSSWVSLELNNFDRAFTINAAGSQPLSLQTNSATPWGIDLRRTDTSFSSRARNTGARWDFEHRPSFAGNIAVDAGNVGSYAPSLTGAGASGTWGINVSGSAASATSVAWGGITGAPAITGLTADTSATANTVVRRDSSGYIFGAYLNQSSGNNENPTISQVMVTNGGDGYLRKASVSALASALSLGSYALLSGASFGGAVSSTAGFTAGAGGVGSAVLSPGDGTHTGYLSWFAANGNRQGYIGYATTTGSTDTGTINFVASAVSFSGATSAVSLSCSSSVSAASFSGSGSGLTGTAGSLTAGAANSVAWTNVSGRPTNVSSFTNDSGYITSSASISGSAASVSGTGSNGYGNRTVQSGGAPSGGADGDITYIY